MTRPRPQTLLRVRGAQGHASERDRLRQRQSSLLRATAATAAAATTTDELRLGGPVVRRHRPGLWQTRQLHVLR